jgi:hypothetical protein
MCWKTVVDSIIIFNTVATQELLHNSFQLTDHFLRSTQLYRDFKFLFSCRNFPLFISLIWSHNNKCYNFFGSIGFWTQGLMLARQVLYHLNNYVSPFNCVCWAFLKDSLILCPGWPWTIILLTSASWVARIIGVSHQHLAKCYNYWLWLSIKEKSK